MAKRGPTLFELINDPARVRLGRTLGAESSPLTSMDDEEQGLLMGGRVLRVPIGYVFIATAIVLAGAALTYSIGFQAGQNRRDRQDARRMQLTAEEAAANQNAAIRDPLVTGTPPARTSASRGATVPGLRSPGSETTSPPASTRTSAPLASGEQRVPGMNYFVVAYYGPDLAERAAAFLRESGLAAAVISANNARFNYVISLKPFAPEEVGTPAYREHEALIKRLGRIWKRDHKGPDDFSEVWAQKYRGPQPSASEARASVGGDQEE